MKKKIDLKSSVKAEDYFETFNKIHLQEKTNIQFSITEKTSIIQEVIDYLEKKEAKKRAQ